MIENRIDYLVSEELLTDGGELLTGGKGTINHFIDHLQLYDYFSASSHKIHVKMYKLSLTMI